MKKYATVAGIILSLVLGGLKLISRKAEGYARATAETAAERVEDAIPAEIHDKKLDNEVRSVRLEMIDRQIQMNLTSRQIEQLAAEVSQLEGNVDRRRRLLAESYLVLKAAIDRQQKTVNFANQEYALADFQTELDDLLAMQDRETRQVEIKTAGLARLKQSAEAGQAALTEMKHALDTTDQEVELLRNRREMAGVEALTLDLVSSATAAQSESMGSAMNEGFARLKSAVERIECRNEARRGMSSPEQRPSSRGLERHMTRIEALKGIHDSASSTEKTTQPEPLKTDAAVPTKLTITVEGTPSAE